MCKIEDIEGKGRGLVLTRRTVEAGTLLVKEQALVVLGRDQVYHLSVRGRGIPWHILASLPEVLTLEFASWYIPIIRLPCQLTPNRQVDCLLIKDQMYCHLSVSCDNLIALFSSGFCLPAVI